MESFKITLKDHLRHLWMFFLVAICIPVIVYLLMIYRWGHYDKQVALSLIILGVLVLSIVQLTLHFNHFFRNRNCEFVYNRNSGDMQFVNNKGSFSFGIRDVQVITVFKTKPLANKKTPINVWDEYNYAIIELKGGDLMKISSLLVFELDKVVKFDNIEVKEVFYPWIS